MKTKIQSILNQAIETVTSEGFQVGKHHSYQANNTVTGLVGKAKATLTVVGEDKFTRIAREAMETVGMEGFQVGKHHSYQANNTVTGLVAKAQRLIN